METNQEVYKEILQRDPLLIQQLQMNLNSGQSKEDIIKKLKEIESQGYSQGTTVESIIKALDHMTPFTTEKWLMIRDLKEDVELLDDDQE